MISNLICLWIGGAVGFCVCGLFSGRRVDELETENKRLTSIVRGMLMPRFEEETD